MTAYLKIESFETEGFSCRNCVLQDEDEKCSIIVNQLPVKCWFGMAWRIKDPPDITEFIDDEAAS
jgi:hypothetical protein